MKVQVNIIEEQLRLEFENRSIAYLIWRYDQNSDSWDGWKDYINLFQLCRIVRIKKLTEKVVERGYLEENGGR